MNRYNLLQHLARARQHVAIGEVHLARQHEIIVEFERDGHDATEAKKLFAQFIVMQALHIKDCRRLEGDLENIESDPTSDSRGSSLNTEAPGVRTTSQTDADSERFPGPTDIKNALIGAQH